jgi:hypothetical protein
VPFSKHKSRRSPLQRLSDQRRSLVLAGLAVGAAFSAAVFRRKRRGEEVEFESVVQFEENVAVVAPEPEVPAVEASVPGSDPEPADSPRPINAAPAGGSAAVAESAAGSEPAPVEPATGELSAEEASILAVLAQSGRAGDDRTAIAVATSLERETGDVADVLRKLVAEGVVSGELYTASGDRIWAVTERGVRRLGAQS